MRISNQTKYRAVAISFFALIAFFIYVEIRIAFMYIIWVLFSIYIIKFLKMEPIIGKVSKSVLCMCGVFFIFIITTYYYRFVWVDPNKPYVMKGVSASPIFVGLVMAPIIEEIAFRRVFLGALLQANMHWFVASCIATLLFMSVHSPSSWLYMAVPTLLLAMIYARSGSLMLVIFLHFSNNLVYRIQPEFWQDLLR